MACDAVIALARTSTPTPLSHCRRRGMHGHVPDRRVYCHIAVRLQASDEKCFFHHLKMEPQIQLQDLGDCRQIPVQRNLTRNSSGDEIANVNFLYEDIVHALQNTIYSCINSATDWRGYVLERRFTKFSEITQCNDHYAVQVCHPRSPILVPIESSYTTSY